MTIREQSEEISEALGLVMDEVFQEPTVPAIMKADLQQTVATELERMRGLNIYAPEVLWYNAMVAGNFIQRAIEAMQEEQRPSVDRRQWSEFLYQSAQEEQEEDEDDDEQMTEEEIIDVLVDELWSKLPDEPYPDQIEFVLLESAMEIESEEGIFIEDHVLEKVINEYKSFTDRVCPRDLKE
tara:strand:- start:475 stop:1020 length:546 start_codon:yes stop_codon:yes gene_type:complete